MRIAPVSPGTRPELAFVESQILAERGRISPLYQVLLNSPAMAQGWEQMLSAVRNRNSLSADLRELIILRVAVLNRARYEFDAHVPHALAAGAPQAKIEALQDAASLSPQAFTPLEHHALTLTDTMTCQIDVPQAQFDAVRALLNDQELIDLLVTIAAYNMVSRFLVALHIGH